MRELRFCRFTSRPASLLSWAGFPSSSLLKLFQVSLFQFSLSLFVLGLSSILKFFQVSLSFFIGSHWFFCSNFCVLFLLDLNNHFYQSCSKLCFHFSLDNASHCPSSLTWNSLTFFFHCFSFHFHFSYIIVVGVTCGISSSSSVSISSHSDLYMLWKM